MKKLKSINSVILIVSLILTGCGNSQKSKSSDPSQSYTYHCLHCGKGFNGTAYLYDGTPVGDASQNETVYCSKSCQLADQ